MLFQVPARDLVSSSNRVIISYRLNIKNQTRHLWKDNVALPTFPLLCTLWLDPETGSLLAMPGTISRPCWSTHSPACCVRSLWDCGPLVVGLRPVGDGTARAWLTLSSWLNFLWGEASPCCSLQTDWFLSFMNGLNCTRFTEMLFSVQHALRC